MSGGGSGTGRRGGPAGDDEVPSSSPPDPDPEFDTVTAETITATDVVITPRVEHPTPTSIVRFVGLRADRWVDPDAAPYAACLFRTEAHYPGSDLQANGSYIAAGVGALHTLTADTDRAFENDVPGGAVVGDRILYVGDNDHESSDDNDLRVNRGIYTLTDAGEDGVSPWVLTRAADLSTIAQYTEGALVEVNTLFFIVANPVLESNIDDGEGTYLAFYELDEDAVLLRADGGVTTSGLVGGGKVLGSKGVFFGNNQISIFQADVQPTTVIVGGVDPAAGQPGD